LGANITLRSRGAGWADCSAHAVEAAGADVSLWSLRSGYSLRPALAGLAFDALNTFVALGTLCAWLAVVASLSCEAARAGDAGRAWLTLWTHRAHWTQVTDATGTPNSNVDHHLALALAKLGVKIVYLSLKRLHFRLQ